MHKAIRQFLEGKLGALELARSEGTEGRDLPVRIGFWPAPKNLAEARLHGILEGLYVAGKINEHEASDWHSRFRSVLAVPGDPGTVVGYIGDTIPADVRAARTQPAVANRLDDPCDYAGHSRPQLRHRAARAYSRRAVPAGN